jgi:hypothetical protein
MSDTRIMSRPYVIGGTNTSFVVPAAGASLLLDPGILTATATMAYSSRKLRTAYAGKALKARTTDGTDSNADIGFTGTDLDTGALATLVSGAGATAAGIDTWYDQTVTAVTNNNGTRTQIPLIVTGSANITQNGHVWAAGTTAHCLFSSSGALGFARPTSFAILARYDTVANNQVIFGDFNGGLESLIQGASTFFGMSNGSFMPSTVAADTSLHSFFGTFNGASSSIVVDGTTTNGNAGANVTINEIDLWIFNGNAHIAEVIFFQNTTLSGTDITTIRTSWQSYWGAP